MNTQVFLNGGAIRRDARKRNALVVVASAVLWCGALAVSPAVRAAAPDDKPKQAAPKPPAEDSEVKMGREAHEQMLQSGIRLIKDPKIVERVETIGKKIAAAANETPIPAGYGSAKLVPYDYKFFVVDDRDVNAFCLPGGYVYVNKGLLDYVQSDDELAGVLGHEITHAVHHHVVRLQREQNRLNGQMALGMLAAILAKAPTEDMMNLMTGLQLVAIQKINGFSQVAERDADHGGLILTRKAGYNPVGALTFMERLGRDQRSRPDVELGIFRTHPVEKERAEAMISQLNTMEIRINRREVTNSLRVAVRPVAVLPKKPVPPTPANPDALPDAAEVMLDGKPLYRAATTVRAQKVADALNKILDSDVQIYDVTRKGTQLLIKGEPLLDASEADAQASATASATPESVADGAYKALRNALFRQLLQNSF